MTNASATKPRKRSARITAIATDSTVSRQPPSGGAGLSALAGFFVSFVLLVFVIPQLSNPKKQHVAEQLNNRHRYTNVNDEPAVALIVGRVHSGLFAFPPAI